MEVLQRNKTQESGQMTEARQRKRVLAFWIGDEGYDKVRGGNIIVSLCR